MEKPIGKSCSLSGLIQRCFNVGFNVAEEKSEAEVWRHEKVFVVTDSEDEEVLYVQPKNKSKEHPREQAKETTSLLQQES